MYMSQQEGTNVLVRMEMSKWCLVPKDGVRCEVSVKSTESRYGSKVYDMDVDISVRRSMPIWGSNHRLADCLVKTSRASLLTESDGAVTTLMRGSADYLEEAEQEDTASWAFVGASRWERAYSHNGRRGEFLGFDRMGRLSLYENQEADGMRCEIGLLPEYDENGDLDETKPALVESALLEICDGFSGEVLGVAEMSKLLTAKHLVRWKVYD